MGRGRPRHAPALLEAEGYYRKHPERKPEEGALIEGTPGRPEPPLLVRSDDLSVDIWNETCDTLDSLGLLTKTDLFLLEAFCINLRELYHLTELIRQNGHGQFSDDGTRKTCPNVVSFHKCMGTHIKLLSELALTPQARLRVLRPPSTDGDGTDEVGDLMKKLGNG